MKLFVKHIIIVLCVLPPSVVMAQPNDRNNSVDLYSEVRDQSEIQPGENIDEKIHKNFFLKADVTKTTCYVGEPIMATFKAYSRLDANSQVAKRPSLSGFSVIEMVDAYSNQPEVEKYNGEYFYVHLIRKVQLFPLQPGSFTLEPAEVESVIHLRDGSNKGRGLRHLRDFFRRGERNNTLQRQVTFKTPEVNIEVKPLPEADEPERFSGAVGKFSIELKMDDSTGVQHQPLTVRLLIKGTGNFPLITDPEIEWPKGVVVSDPIVTEDVNKYVFPLSGVKEFQYVLDHSDTGTYIIPPIKFTYFDPASKSYQSAQSLPQTYSVKVALADRQIIDNSVFKRRTETPLHFYYLGILAVLITAVIIFFAVRRAKRDES